MSSESMTPNSLGPHRGASLTSFFGCQHVSTKHTKPPPPEHSPKELPFLILIPVTCSHSHRRPKHHASFSHAAPPFQKKTHIIMQKIASRIENPNNHSYDAIKRLNNTRRLPGQAPVRPGWAGGDGPSPPAPRDPVRPGPAALGDLSRAKLNLFTFMLAPFLAVPMHPAEGRSWT